MELFRRATAIDFMRWQKPTAILSGILVLVSLVSFIARGLEFALDFTGGTLVEVSFDRQVDLSRVRERLTDAGFAGASVQHLGSTREVLIRVAPRTPGDEAESSTLSNRMIAVLRQATGAEVDIRRVEYVGPQVGEELREQGGLAVLAALGGILIYVTLRFQWRFAVASVVALAHDAIITVGIFSAFALEFDLTVLAAVLAVIGYSLNDTIVVFDRTRENFRRLRNKSPVEVMNVSINQTLSRTVMTGVTTLLVLVALIVAGGPALFGFSLALIIGVLVGTYSSVYIASSAALALGVSRADLLTPESAEHQEQAPGAPAHRIRRT